MTEKKWEHDKNDDVLARATHAAELVYAKEQDAARQFDERRADSLKEQEKRESYFRQEQAKKDAQEAQAALLASAQQNHAQQAHGINEQLSAHSRDAAQVNHKELSSADKERWNHAHEIKRDFVDKGEMRDSHSIGYPIRGGSVYEQAANRELDADRDFANRQQQLADKIGREKNAGQREYLETLKAAEYHSHKAESWEIITEQRKGCGYQKSDIDYARDKAASHQMEAAKAIEKMQELEAKRSQELTAKGKPQEAAQTPQQAPEQARQGQSMTDAEKALEALNLINGDLRTGEAQNLNEPRPEPRDMAFLERMSREHGPSGLRDDIVKLEERHNAQKDKQEHSTGLKGDIERLEERHNQTKQQPEQEPRRTRSSSEFEM